MYQRNLSVFFCAPQGVTKEDIERAELALQAANKGIDLAAVSANKRSSENKENKPEGNKPEGNKPEGNKPEGSDVKDSATTTTILRKVWTDVSRVSSVVLTGRLCWKNSDRFVYKQILLIVFHMKCIV